jgi:nitrite reductase (NADH) large subunit
MQKDGSYSVVPRMAGGEITPEKLIALGEVGKKYKLYTKITGGQRIDLFGARVEQLPRSGGTGRPASRPATPTARRCAP